MDFNIITPSDIARPPSDRSFTEETQRDKGIQATVSPDDYWTKIRKYVPAELVGGYLILDNLTRQIWDGEALQVALLAAGVLVAIMTWIATGRVFGIRRASQRMMSVVALIIYAVASGMLNTFPWWQPAIGTLLIVIFALLAFSLRLSPLPET